MLAPNGSYRPFDLLFETLQKGLGTGFRNRRRGHKMAPLDRTMNSLGTDRKPPAVLFIKKDLFVFPAHFDQALIKLAMLLSNVFSSSFGKKHPGIAPFLR